jgi:uncharacterized RDD family membrane protein YckC
MVAVPAVDPVSAAEPTPIAGFWRRLDAFAVDCLVLAVPAMFLGLALFDLAESLGGAGRLIGVIAALLYFGLMNSRLGRGQTLGKRLLGLRVVDRSGGLLSPARSIVRFIVFSAPYFLSGLWFDGCGAGSAINAARSSCRCSGTTGSPGAVFYRGWWNTLDVAKLWVVVIVPLWSGPP